MEQIKIKQPERLRTIDDVVTSREFDSLVDCSLTSLQTVPLIMPDANYEALRKADIRLEVVGLPSLPDDERKGTLNSLAVTYASVFAGEPWNEVSRCETTGKFFPDQPGLLCTCCGKETTE